MTRSGGRRNRRVGERPREPADIAATSAGLVAVGLCGTAASFHCHASAVDADGAGRRPPSSAGVPAGHVPFPVFPAHDERDGLEVRNNHDAMRRLEEVLRNPLIRRRHNR
jgi:hypothetical protein